MPDAGEVAQLVGSLGSVLVAAIAIVANNRTTAANLRAQRTATAEQLDQQREALARTLAAQAQQIRDERLWDRRMALYEDLGAWSGTAFQAVSRLLFEIQAMPAKDFQSAFAEAFGRFEPEVGPRWFALYGRVQIYAGESVRERFLRTSPSIVGLAGDYSKGSAADWASKLFSAVTDMQDQLRATIADVSPGS